MSKLIINLVEQRPSNSSFINDSFFSMEQKVLISDVVRQVNFLMRSNQKREALSAIQIYFNSPLQENVSEESFNFLVSLAIKLSTQFLVHIPSIIKAIIQFCDNDSLNTFFMTYIQECRIMIGDKQQYSAEAKDIINCPISSTVVDQLLVNPSMNFSFKVYISILENLRQNKVITKLYFQIINQGYQTAMDFESQQLHDMISKELDHLCGNLKLKNSVRYRVVDSLFLRFKTALELGLYKRAFKSLCDASFLISSPDAPIELHEHVEVQKAVLLEIRENRVPAAIQLLNLIKFYETTPVPPSMPLQSLADLALMTALAGDLHNRTDTSYEKLLGCKTMPRDEVVSVLIEKVKRLSLKKFALVAEEHKNPTEICMAFKNFLSEYGKEFHVPSLFKALGQYAAYRIIQAALSQRNEVPISELETALKWMTNWEIHRAIIDGNKNGIFKCKIDMMKNCIVNQ
ncbi:hypothetical protein TRFO_00958 [Tritrichomonas foetus]|uniref:PCI domain-containing protein n=1 Tax=Tritrichomonas foetus TaxID=1144522 RepID=A0A1J4L2C3_9EUKA|nr:hypothetical protein TRFO_00958 [Tritrichomonas foetus]|eukprot:OHT17665.1 hypothetical protein TRFO_00958 [Tritrichomonas foetus]